MARWLNWLERPVHTREVASSSLALATKIRRIRKDAFFYVIFAIKISDFLPIYIVKTNEYLWTRMSEVKHQSRADDYQVRR